MQSNRKLDEICEKFTQKLNELYDNVISITLFGSAVTEEYQPEKSDINFLVVLSKDAIQNLEKVQSHVKQWQKQKVSLPLFITKEYIQDSLDTFPIEFLNMQSAYRVLYGEDVLAPLKFDQKDLRLQCERELKGKLLQLRQGFIMTGGKSKALQSLISQSIITFVSIFRALLFLQGKGIPSRKIEALLGACDEFEEIDRELFQMLLKIRNNEIKKSKFELEEIVKNYILSISNLSETVDKIEI